MQESKCELPIQSDRQDLEFKISGNSKNDSKRRGEWKNEDIITEKGKLGRQKEWRKR